MTLGKAIDDLSGHVDVVVDAMDRKDARIEALEAAIHQWARAADGFQRGHPVHLLHAAERGLRAVVREP